VDLGVQYYRAPFPEEKYWADDFAKIRDSGLNTVQLWVLWGWVEARPGEFRFEDYDRLMQLAEKNGLGVILSTIAEIHPYWIHREVPGSEMIDHMGRKVVSSNRRECHFGLTPGGCFDHPGVWDRMGGFLREVVSRYRSAAHLRGWDAWNELRWNVNSDGMVCFCEHTIDRFHQWLDERYGGLDGLNRAWKRRYGQWDEVLPGKTPDRPYTEMMAFEHFITWRANRHGKDRYDLIRSLDADRPITAHGGEPCAMSTGSAENHVLNRGNDWHFADDMDGVGCSSFPKWWGMDDVEFGTRVEFVKSASQGKHVWLSEVQAGRASTGFQVHVPVDPASQQRWIWNGIACGVDTLLFWCWRDEVFGSESAGFGLIGDDGQAEQRVAAMQRTGQILETHAGLIDAYRPLDADVGVWFSPQSYYLYWAQDHTAGRARDGVLGYCRGLVRNCIPYRVVEEAHPKGLEGLKVLFMPRSLVTDEPTEKVLEDWVRAGGTLVCESECGAFSPQGIYRYPADRFTARLAGIRELGRRALEKDSIAASTDGLRLRLPVTQWLTPWETGKGSILASDGEGSLIVEVPVGKGKLVLVGSYLGDAYLDRPSRDFERFIGHLVEQGGCEKRYEVLSPEPTDDASLYVKVGQSGDRKMVFVFFPSGVRLAQLRFAEGFFDAGAEDLISGKQIQVERVEGGQEIVIPTNEWRICVLVESATR
jgi:beta-galactosidase